MFKGQIVFLLQSFRCSQVVESRAQNGMQALLRFSNRILQRRGSKTQRQWGFFTADQAMLRGGRKTIPVPGLGDIWPSRSAHASTVVRLHQTAFALTFGHDLQFEFLCLLQEFLAISLPARGHQHTAKSKVSSANRQMFFGVEIFCERNCLAKIRLSSPVGRATLCV